MPRRSAWHTCACGRVAAIPAIVLLLALFAAAFLSGCAAQPDRPFYRVDAGSNLSLHCTAPQATATIMAENASWTLEAIRFHNIDTEIYALLAVPQSPRAAIVFAEGAGVRKEAHRDRALWYAERGIAFMVLDIRGNGGETAGRPLDLEDDYRRYVRGEWPEYYKIVCDLCSARMLLDERFQVPVYAMGSSNGGRYAAIAASLDEQFAGYIGVSTSGFGLAGTGYSGDARSFLLSVDPDHAIGRISPRPVHLYHAPADPIIPIDAALATYRYAGDPKTFYNFSGGHGLNSEVDGNIAESV